MLRRHPGDRGGGGASPPADPTLRKEFFDDAMKRCVLESNWPKQTRWMIDSWKNSQVVLEISIHLDICGSMRAAAWAIRAFLTSFARVPQFAVRIWWEFSRTASSDPSPPG